MSAEPLYFHVDGEELLNPKHFQYDTDLPSQPVFSIGWLNRDGALPFPYKNNIFNAGDSYLGQLHYSLLLHCSAVYWY